MPGQCCVPRCNVRGGHLFPKERVMRCRWIHAVRRGENKWQPSKWSTVCANHFDDSDFVKLSIEGRVMPHRKLLRTAVPHLFSWTSASAPSSLARQERMGKRSVQDAIADNSASVLHVHDVGAEETVNTSIHNDVKEKDGDVSTQTVTVNVEDSGCQTDEQKCDCEKFSAVRYKSSPEMFHYYTGLQTHSNFQMIMATFGTDIDHLNYYYHYVPKLCLEDQFFLTLAKLRLNRNNLELADKFNISMKDVSNIFITWIHFLYFHFKDLNWWPAKELVSYFSPSDFSNKFPTTRVIIDGTEIPLMKSKNPVIQQASYSTYKNRNTVKALIGVSPGGLVTYVSNIYCGSASDRQICERSSLMQILEPNDSIMADKGFNVQDLFIETNVKLNIPEFFKKKNRMSPKYVLNDRKIASKRVHVERIIGLAKTFRILTRPLSLTEAPLADAIVSTCFFLCNFRSCIVPNDA